MIIGNLPAGPSDLVRQLVNLAINCGRSLQSPQTGYVHYNYRQLDYSTYDTIPLYENFLLALALMRERTSESFAEGKALIEKLLYFQVADGSDSAGNFPVYLHEYPVCKDRNVAAHILPICYWILRTFPVVLGQELRERFETATQRMVEYCLRFRETLSFVNQLKIAIASKALNTLWGKGKDQLADRILEELVLRSQAENFSSWYVPAMAGEALMALQMIYPKIGDSPWAALWKWAEDTWHVHTASYVGPGYRDYQAKEQPEVTTLDLIMGFHTGVYSYRTMVNSPRLLTAALIHPTDDIVYYPSLPRHQEGVVEGRPWFISQDRLWACSALKKHMVDPSQDGSYSAVRLVWGDLNCAHTFVCQGCNATDISFVAVEHGVDVLLKLPEEIPSEVKQRNREVTFFLDAHEDVSFIVGEHAAANTFQIDEPVKISSGSMNIDLRMFVEEGSGHFFGHIVKGNRPSQRYCTGDGRFKTYDWQLFLRTVDREKNCSIRVEIRFMPK